MEIVKEKTIAFTGNRKLTSEDGRSHDELRIPILNLLMRKLEKEYLENGKTTFISGMALGFDTLAAIVVRELKRKYPEIQLIAAVPFIGQEAKYPPQDQKLYTDLLDAADYTIVIGGKGFSTQAYHDRNDFLIENVSKIYAYHNGKPRSGTGSTIRKAQKQGVEVVNLYDII